MKTEIGWDLLREFRKCFAMFSFVFAIGKQRVFFIVPTAVHRFECLAESVPFGFDAIAVKRLFKKNLKNKERNGDAFFHKASPFYLL